MPFLQVHALPFPLQNPRRSPTATILFVWMISLIAYYTATLNCRYSWNTIPPHHTFILKLLWKM